MVNLSLNVSPVWLMFIIFAIIAYFVYDHSISAVIGIMIIAAVIFIVFILSYIPVIGWIAAVLVCYYWVIPELYDVMLFEHAWFITLIFVVIALYGLAITITTSVASIVVIRKMSK